MRSRDVPGATVGGRIAGTSNPRSRRAALAASALRSSPSTTGTIGEGWPGAMRSTWRRRVATRASPSGERTTRRAARAAAEPAAVDDRRVVQLVTAHAYAGVRERRQHAEVGGEAGGKQEGALARFPFRKLAFELAVQRTAADDEPGCPRTRTPPVEGGVGG